MTRHPAAALASLSSRGATVAARAGSVEDKAKSSERLFASLLQSKESRGGSGAVIETDSSHADGDARAMVDAVISWEELLTNHTATVLLLVLALHVLGHVIARSHLARCGFVMTPPLIQVQRLACLGYSPSVIDTLYSFPKQAELLVDFTVRHSKVSRCEFSPHFLFLFLFLIQNDCTLRHTRPTLFIVVFLF